MIRKMLAASVAVLTLFFGVLSLNAAAGGDCGYYVGASATADCADAVAYDGPFTNSAAPASGLYGWGTLNVVPAGGTGGGAGGTGGGTGGTGSSGGNLAHTGSESTAIAYVGTGMIAFGAVALGGRRKFFQSALD